MTVFLADELQSDLFPVICTCQSCKRQLKVTDYADFTYEPLVSGLDDQQSDQIYVKCPIDGEYAFPSPSLKDTLISFYKLWKAKKAEVYPRWERKIRCSECRVTSLITQDNLRVINTAVASGGETWDPVVVIECPVCESDSPAIPKVPRGIIQSMILSASRKRR